MRYVIIGNSAAAIGAVEGIRQIDTQGEVILTSGEPHHTYSRPLISYLLPGKTTEDRMKYRDDSFYARNHCELLSGTTATGVNAAEKHVVTECGKTISYDKLLVATGSSPFVPPFEGLDEVENKFTFMSLIDARGLSAALSGLKRVLIVGAGLIGLKCAEGIQERAAQVTVLDLAPRILSSILDDDGAKLVQAHLEHKGVRFRLSANIERFEKDMAMLEGGERIDFDILVLAVGVRPNTQLLSGIAEIERGIVVNERCETNAPEIYAAGDCTQSLDVSSGQNKIMALLPNAYMQGECAGINMAGGEKVFNNAIPMNAIGFFGLHIITAGSYDGDVYKNDENGSYKRLFYGGNRLNGYILIGGVEKAGIYTSLIRERTPLNSIDFPLVCDRPGLMTFAKEDRMVKLGGAVR